jgi:hypothetical protein
MSRYSVEWSDRLHNGVHQAPVTDVNLELTSCLHDDGSLQAYNKDQWVASDDPNICKHH